MYTPPNPDRPGYWRKPHDTYQLDEPPPAGLPPSRERVGWLLFAIGWSANELARRLDVSPESARHWATGKRPMPDNLTLWLEDMAAHHVAAGLPKGWNAIE